MKNLLNSFKKVIPVLFLLIFISGSAQDISGSWFWQAENGDAQMEISINVEGLEYIGHHCAVFQNGNRIDCVEEGEPASIYFKKTAKNIFEGKIRSGYSASEGKIKLHFDPEDKTLLLEISEAPENNYFLPKKAFFKKT